MAVQEIESSFPAQKEEGECRNPKPIFLPYWVPAPFYYLDSRSLGVL